MKFEHKNKFSKNATNKKFNYSDISLASDLLVN